MKTLEQYQLTQDAVRLLHSLLKNHQQVLFMNEGEPWQPEELELTEILIETFDPFASE